MAKKSKKYKKKQSSTVVRQSQSTARTPAVATALPAATKQASIPGQSYVGRDLKKIGILVVLCVVLEIGLLLLLDRTQAGQSIYSWFKI